MIDRRIGGIRHVIDELKTRDYQPLVHVPGAHKDTYADVLDRCETHQITIGGRYPDGLGFTRAGRVRVPDESLEDWGEQASGFVTNYGVRRTVSHTSTGWNVTLSQMLA